MVQLVADSLRSWGHEVHPYSNGPAALEALEEIQPEVIITDLYLDKTRAFGLDLLKHTKKVLPSAVVIVVTGFGSIETAVEAMKHGSFDYLEKPFKLDEVKDGVSSDSYFTVNQTRSFFQSQIGKAGVIDKKTKDLIIGLNIDEFKEIKILEYDEEDVQVKGMIVKKLP